MPTAKKSEDVVTCVTDKPIAFDSPDHVCPVGTKNDNSSNGNYIMEAEQLFKKRGVEKMNCLDLGCAGGQLAIDFSRRGHFSVGIEGSDTGIKFELFNWPKYGGLLLHTADVTEPYKILKNGKKVLFDFISAWEVMEHLKREDIPRMLDAMLNNLAPEGMFVCSINMTEDKRTDDDGNVIHLHQSVYPEDVWRSEILADYNVEAYPFNSKVRNHPNGSFFIAITHRKK